MSKLVLLVIIDSEDEIKFLKQQGYSLFLGRLVHGQPQANVIWRSHPDFTYTNLFHWRPIFSIAGIKYVEPGTLVEPSTKVKRIEPGQSIEIDEWANITNASGSVAAGKAFTLTNRDANTNFAAAVYTVDPATPDGTPQIPFFISKVLEKDFPARITPIDTVVVWFGQTQETGTIISEYSGGPAYKVVYGEGDTKHTLKWAKGWEQAD